MKVTLITMAYPHPAAGFWPGIERQVGDFAAALRDAGATVSVITSFRNGGPEREEHEGVRIFRVPDTGQTLGRLGYLFNQHVRSFGANALRLAEAVGDAEVVESFVPLPRAPFLERPGLPVFAFFAHRDRPARWSEYLHQPFHYRMEKEFFRRVRAVLVASSESARVLSVEYGVPRERIELVPLGVAPRFLARVPAAVPACPPRAFSDNGPARLLYVGPLLRRKGLATLIEALPLLRREGIPARAMLVGRGPERGALEARAQRLGVREMVEFAGFVSEQDLQDVYRGADLFVFPSLKEGFGIVLLEAMASALPVVASSAPPIPEVVGEAALLFRPGDPRGLAEAIGRALADAGLRGRLAAEGMRRVGERFDWRRIARRTLEIYRKAGAA